MVAGKTYGALSRDQLHPYHRDPEDGPEQQPPNGRLAATHHACLASDATRRVDSTGSAAGISSARGSAGSESPGVTARRVLGGPLSLEPDRRRPPQPGQE